MGFELMRRAPQFKGCHSKDNASFPLGLNMSLETSVEFWANNDHRETAAVLISCKSAFIPTMYTLSSFTNIKLV